MTLTIEETTAVRRVGVAIVGRGFGRAVHLPGFGLLADAGVEVVALRGRDWTDALADPAVDIVSVATPPSAHAAVALAALGAGKAVFCEKPLATTVADAEELAAAATGVPTAVNFSYRALPAFRRFRELLESDRLEVEWLVDSRLRSGPPGWKDDPEQGGGALAAYGVHALDYAVWLLGPARVTEADIQGHEDTFQAELEHESGARTALRVSMVAPHRLHRLRAGELVLENADARDPVRAFVLKRGAEDVPVPPPARRVGPAEDGRIEPFAVHAEALLGALRGEPPRAPDFADGLAAQRLLDAVRRLGR